QDLAIDTPAPYEVGKIAGLATNAIGPDPPVCDARFEKIVKRRRAEIIGRRLVEEQDIDAIEVEIAQALLKRLACLRWREICLLPPARIGTRGGRPEWSCAARRTRANAPRDRAQKWEQRALVAGQDPELRSDGDFGYPTLEHLAQADLR